MLIQSILTWEADENKLYLSFLGRNLRHRWGNIHIVDGVITATKS